MSINRSVLFAGVLAAIVGAGPAFAQHGGGGGHGGGGHAPAGGGFHGGAAAGAHFGGGAASHYGGGAGPHYGGSSYGGTAGAHYGAANYGAAHFAGAGRYGSTQSYHTVGSASYGGGGGYRGGSAGFHGSPYHGGRPIQGGYGHGYSTGARWGGGYWRGGYWPRAYYGGGFSWFLPVLPLAYATYWYGGVPYYYANDVYYTWSPDYDGYTATDPPPVTDTATDGAAIAPNDAPPAMESAPAPAPGGGAEIFMYPKNGQNQDQLSTDRRECQQWAANEAPAPSGGESNPDDYRRAMLACVEGRGYSAK